MSPDVGSQTITKDNLNEYLKDLAKEFRKRSGGKTPAEIILTGGAAVLAGYGFRDMTNDVDAIINASSVIKEAANFVGDKHGLPNGWLNADFMRTASYSDKLREVSQYYRTFSNVLTIRTVSAEYLLAMKLKSGRQYKNDLSDVIGILREHERNDSPISREAIEKAIAYLYGADAMLPSASAQLLDAVFASGDYETLFNQVRDNETESRTLLIEFENQHPNTLNADNIDSILASKRKKLIDKASLLAKLEEKKRGE